MSKLIVIEGLDGSGKATQAARLTEQMEKNGQPSLKISFPDYESKSSALVQMYLAGEIGDVGDVNSYAASAFYAVDRYVSYTTGWKKAYLDGHTIIADRYATSNAAYQMAKLPAQEWDDYLAWLYDFEFVRMQLPAPDLVAYLDVPPGVSRTLLERRYQGDATRQDIHERNLVYLSACRQAALYAADRLGWVVIDCCPDGELQTVEAVAKAIWKTVERA